MEDVRTVSIAALPQSTQAFVALRNRVAREPHGAAVMMALALLIYGASDDRFVGCDCLTIAVDRQRLEESREGYRGWCLAELDMRLIASQLAAQPFLPKSYIQGATPENNYQLPSPPFAFECPLDPYSGDTGMGTYKTFINSSGASGPRPVTVKRNGRGLWKAVEWSSLIVGIREPQAIQG